MRRSLVKFSESEASNRTPSLAHFTTTTPELKFSVHTGSRRIHPSLRRRSRLGLRAPWFSDDGRRALRRSPRRGISRQGQCDEAAVSAPCCQRPELASNG